jgi:hypothetical protein
MTPMAIRGIYYAMLDLEPTVLRLPSGGYKITYYLNLANYSKVAVSYTLKNGQWEISYDSEWAVGSLQ